MANLELKSEFSAQQLTLLQTEMDKRKQSTGVAYMLLLLFSILGAHHFYLRQKVKGIIYLIISSSTIFVWMSSWAVIFAGISSTKEVAKASGATAGIMLIIAFLLSGTALILFIYDLFTLPRQVCRANEKIEGQAILQIQSTSSAIAEAA